MMKKIIFAMLIALISGWEFNCKTPPYMDIVEFVKNTEEFNSFCHLHKVNNRDLEVSSYLQPFCEYFVFFDESDLIKNKSSIKDECLKTDWEKKSLGKGNKISNLQGINSSSDLVGFFSESNDGLLVFSIEYSEEQVGPKAALIFLVEIKGKGKFDYYSFDIIVN